MITRIIFLLAFSFITASNVFAQGNASRSFEQYSGNWASFRLCGIDGSCVWRASTKAANTDDLLALDWPESEKLDAPIIQLITNVDDAVISSWINDSDYVHTQLRVDLNPIRNSFVLRNIDRAFKVIFSTVPPDTANKSFVLELKRGNTLRYRTDVNGFKHTRQFSLRGATKAISRAETMAKAAYEMKHDNYDPYFDDPSLYGKRARKPDEVFF